MSTFWHQTGRASILAKIRKTITIPAFAVRCGEENFSLDLQPRDNGSTTASANGAGYSIVAAFTIEAWLKTSHSHPTKGFVFVNYRSIDGSSNVDIGLLNGKIVVRLQKSSSYTTLTSASDYPTGEWFKLSVVYNGSNCKIYVNGVLDANTATLAANLDAATGNLSSHVWGADAGGASNFYVGLLAEMTVRNIALTKEQIIENLYYRRGKNTGLLSYYKAVDTALLELVTNTSYIIGASVRSTDIPPLIYGASFIAAKFELEASSAFALKYPVNVPSDANFMLCVSYISGDETVRYRLWDMDGVDFAPVPERYRGQTLPANFTFEAWSIDGESDCTLSDDLTLQVSKVSIPTSMNDTAASEFIEDATIDYSIFQTFPLSFPLTFESSGWGTVASPVSQPVGTYSSNLTNYGSIQ